jgi:hypothetical protein
MEIDICPRWLVVKLGVPRDVQRDAALLSSGLVALLIAPVLIHVPHVCLMRKLFGIPCPGCGILHSLTAVLTLQFGLAWHFNPAGISLAGLFGFQVVVRLFAIMSAKAPPIVELASRWGSGCVLACLLAVWMSRLAR